MHVELLINRNIKYEMSSDENLATQLNLLRIFYKRNSGKKPARFKQPRISSRFSYFICFAAEFAKFRSDREALFCCYW